VLRTSFSISFPAIMVFKDHGNWLLRYLSQRNSDTHPQNGLFHSLCTARFMACVTVTVLSRVTFSLVIRTNYWSYFLVEGALILAQSLWIVHSYSSGHLQNHYTQYCASSDCLSRQTKRYVVLQTAYVIYSSQFIYYTVEFFECSKVHIARAVLKLIQTQPYWLTPN